MGCDIHAVFQAKTYGTWVDVESTWDQGRHYFLFSWLANVRNGYGFAGVKTYDPVAPISEPRGYPKDFVVNADDEHPVSDKAILGLRAEWLEPGEPPSMWMGDHSHSWLLADEILNAQRPGSIKRTGIVPRQFYDTWDGKTPPKAGSGGITGRDIIVADIPPPPFATHVRIDWTQPDDGLDYFVDEVKRLKELHGEVRLVFGFDN